MYADLKLALAAALLLACAACVDASEQEVGSGAGGAAGGAGGGGGGGGASVQGCVSDEGCPAGSICRPDDGAAFPRGLVSARCVPLVGEDDTGALCDPALTPATAPAEVESLSPLCVVRGLCADSCDGVELPACRCNHDDVDSPSCIQPRCTKLCEHARDCPSRTQCLSWPFFRRELELQGTVKACLQPTPTATFDWSCWDERDCCVDGRTRYGLPCCDLKRGVCAGPTAEVTHCRIGVAEPGGTRWLARCGEPTGRATIGEPCTAHAACESELCAPEGRCTSPCDPGPGDRCASILEGTQCCPTPVDGLCVPACRTDCATGPTCTPT